MDIQAKDDAIFFQILLIIYISKIFSDPGQIPFPKHPLFPERERITAVLKTITIIQFNTYHIVLQTSNI